LTFSRRIPAAYQNMYLH